MNFQNKRSSKRNGAYYNTILMHTPQEMKNPFPVPRFLLQHSLRIYLPKNSQLGNRAPMTHCPSIPRRFSAPNSTTSPHCTVKAQSHTHSPRKKQANKREKKGSWKIEKKSIHTAVMGSIFGQARHVQAGAYRLSPSLVYRLTKCG
ncbi:hypothetical protein TNIN_453891 [Trichonephila inaurata madagascariensis]|uniref:Uncharacterized protein n=1 Tax=Trichonephila inaurata madagascariensis TaxID=2747483 RepID=A0A8X7C342_9ARAC|nr:hypothetical protein TNIN_453891 [Trichonephila inaurata madagascariensis]